MSTFRPFSVFLFCLGLCVSAHAGSDPGSFERGVLEVLHEQGAITDAQQRELESRINREQTPPVSAGHVDAGWKFTWKNGFRLASPDGDIRLKFGGRIHLDAAAIHDSSGGVWGNDFGTEFRRARLFFQGELYEHLIFKAQYEFAGPGTKFKDVYVGLRNLPWVGTVKAGQFKEAFGLGELTSSKYITFVERSLPTLAFAPARRTGVGFQSTAFDKRVTWALGGFFSETEGGKSQLSNESEYQVTGRVTALPIYEGDGTRLVHLGVAYSHRFKGDGGVGFKARPEAHLASAGVATPDLPSDGVDKLGVEFALVMDSLSLQAEAMPTWVDGGSAGDDLFFWGAYAQASWFVTGEHRAYDTGTGVFTRTKLKESFSISKRTWGALELAARYSYLDLSDEGIRGGIENNVTLGANWYLYSNLRLMLNWVHAKRNGDGDADIVEGRISLDF